MQRSLMAAVLAAFTAMIAVAPAPSAGQDPPQALRAALAEAGVAITADIRVKELGDGTILFDRTAQSADVRQQSLHALDLKSKRITDVFPGANASTFAGQIQSRLDEMLTRVSPADRDALVAQQVSAGVDRSITSWRAHPAAPTVALAVRYSRDRLSDFKVPVSDDYGRPDPLDVADFEFYTIGLCTRGRAGNWICEEEHLAVVARTQKMELSFDRATWNAAADKLLELLLADK